jgi:tetratricopeptide (TPR) repeat protein
MPNDRLETLRKFVEANPADCFARYGMAQEYLKRGEHENALEQFAKIIEINPDYQAAYYHGGKACEKLGRTEDARATYQKGIALAARSGDLHAQSELQAALDELSGR